MKYPTVGTVSHGTVRNEHLIPAFIDTLRDLYGTNKYSLHPDARNRIESLLKEAEGALKDPESDKAFEILYDLEENINRFCPNYMYFGAHPGGGSDIGFWIDFDAIETDVNDGDLLKVSDLGKVPEEHEGFVLVVNDHGNMSLYTCSFFKQFTNLIWSIV